MKRNITDTLLKITNVIEDIIALVLILVIIIATVATIIHDFPFKLSASGTQMALTEFLEGFFNIIIAIEFVKVLIKRSADSVIEILVFSIARELIVNKPEPLEMLFVVLALAILFGIRKYLLISTDVVGEGKKESSSHEIEKEE